MILPKHYIKSALTNYKRNKWYTSLMVLSLAAGMFCFILASSYVNFEYSRNDSHEHADRVYQLRLKIENRKVGTSLTADFASRIKAINPDIEAVNLIDTDYNYYVSANGQDYVKEKQAFYSDGDLFNIFTFPLKYGDAKTALDGQGKVIISSQLADVLYPGVNPLGEELIVNDKGTFLISGVLEKIGAKTLIAPNIIFPRPELSAEAMNYDVLLTHVKISEGANIEEVSASLYESFKNTYGNGLVEGVLAESLNDAYWGYSHYNYTRKHYSITGSTQAKIRTIGYISIGILLCAFVGYLSLSLGLSLKRSKEIGIRKVNGAGKSDIRVQLLSESMFYSLLSLLIAVVALELFSPAFSSLLGIPIGLSYNSTQLVLGLVLFAVFTGLAAGAYPAFVVSRLSPMRVLSGYNSKLGAGFRLKQGLLVVQFVMAITLVFFVFGQHLQVEKMKGFDFGFQKEGIVAFNIRRENIKRNFPAILEEIKGMSGVTAISGGPFPASFNGFTRFELDKGDTLLKASVSKIFIEKNFFEVMDINVTEGLTFLASEVPNTRACVINRPFAAMLGEDPIGLTINISGKPMTVIGVVGQYVDLGINHFGSDPRVFLVSEEPNYHSLLIAHNEENTAALITQLNDVWRSHEKVIPPNVTNLVEMDDAATSALARNAKLFTFLASVLLTLSLLNLLGVSMSYAVGEVKNISIRRVLGAEAISLFFRLLTPFFKMLGIGLLIALPLAYWLMEDYLANYTVRIDLTAVHGIVITAAMALILLLIIGFQMFRISNINPVDTLKEG